VVGKLLRKPKQKAQQKRETYSPPPFKLTFPEMTSMANIEINAAYPFATEKRVASAIAVRRSSSNAGDAQNPFYVVDLEPVVSRFLAWRTSLPCVEPHYAVKCNPNPVLLKTLAALGAGFDCASSDEMDRVMSLGVAADRIIFANPCKMATQITHARQLGVTRMTFDNEDELLKVAQCFPEAELVLRIATDDSHSQCRFSTKFGAAMEDVPSILETAARLGLNIVGVSYHVGSGCGDPRSHAAAATDALAVFHMGVQYGFRMTLLDIGGGFLGEDNPSPSVGDIAANLLPVLDRFPMGTRFIAEPGRYFATACHTLVANIQSRRLVKDHMGNVTRCLYYINEGVYHGFNCIFFDHQHPLPRTMLFPGLEDRPIVPCTVFGPTCDSIDCVCKDVLMPVLGIGDWLFFTNMGAYTTAATTHFNGFAGAVDYVYMFGDAILSPSLLETVDSVSATLSHLVRTSVSSDEDDTIIAPDSPVLSMD